MKLFELIREAFRKEPTMPHHAEDHNEAASLLELHLANPVSGSDQLFWPDHAQLHNERFCVSGQRLVNYDKAHS